MNRREFLRTAGGAGGAAAAVSAAGAGPAAAADGGGNGTAGGNASAGGNQTGGGEGGGGGPPDLGGYLDGVSNFGGSVTSMRGQSNVTVEVGVEANGGAYGFGPPAIHVDNGATVTWEWTGEGGQHNVVHEEGNFESELLSETGATFEHTFAEDGVYQYFCQPHKGQGMKGVVVVGTDYPTAGGGGVQAMEPTHFGVPFQPHFVGAATILMMMVSLVFAFFTLKYGESAHTKGGNN